MLFKATTVALFATMMSLGSLVSASPTDPSIIFKRQGNWWTTGCSPEPGGTVTGPLLTRLRDVFSTAFNGDFGGDLDLDQMKGVCCEGQCLYVGVRGDSRTWDNAGFDDGYNKLVEEVGDSATGLCGGTMGEDQYLIVFTVRGDAVSVFRDGYKDIGEVIGDTCAGAPGYIG